MLVAFTGTPNLNSNSGYSTPSRNVIITPGGRRFEQYGNYLVYDRLPITITYFDPYCCKEQRLKRDEYSLFGSYCIGVTNRDLQLERIQTFFEDQYLNSSELRIPNVLSIITLKEFKEGNIGLNKCYDYKEYLKSITELEEAISKSKATYIATTYPRVRRTIPKDSNPPVNSDEYYCYPGYVASRMLNLAKKYEKQIIKKMSIPYDFNEEIKALRESKKTTKNDFIEYTGLSKRVADLMDEAFKATKFLQENLPLDDQLIGAILFGSLAERDYYPNDIDIVFVKEKSDKTSLKLPKELQKNINPLLLTEEMIFKEIEEENERGSLIFNFYLAANTLMLYGDERVGKIKKVAIDKIKKDRQQEFLEYLCGKEYDYQKFTNNPLPLEGCLSRGH